MINVTKSYFPDRGKLDKYIDRVYESGWMTNNGQLVQELEQRLKDFLGVEYLVLVANGTLALQVAYRVLELSGDVITTPFSFVATTNSLIWENLNPVFSDIDPGSFNLDPHLIERSITPETTAVLPVHVFGNACDVDMLDVVCKRNNLKLIYDAAHAFNVSSSDQNVLKYGDASILSFHATKIFHTIEGGAIIFKNEDHYRKAKLLINFGISGYDKVDLPGINCKMNEFQAAMGLAVLDDFEQISLDRRKVWERYSDALAGKAQIRLQDLNKEFKNNYSYFPVVFSSEAHLLYIRQRLNEHDIQPRRYFYPSLNKLEYLKHSNSCTVSEKIAESILCLPIFPGLDEKIQNEIIQIVSENYIQ